MTLSRETKQKQVLQRTVDSFQTFFTAEDLLAQAQQQDTKISMATTYRFLKEQREQEQLHSFLCDRKTLYSRNKASHAHYACQTCGTITHFPLANLNFMHTPLPGTICHFQLEIHGECSGCMKHRAGKK